jgi:hypothetical protein
MGYQFYKFVKTRVTVPGGAPADGRHAVPPKFIFISSSCIFPWLGRTSYLTYASVIFSTTRFTNIISLLIIAPTQCCFFIRLPLTAVAAVAKTVNI